MNCLYNTKLLVGLELIEGARVETPIEVVQRGLTHIKEQAIKRSKSVREKSSQSKQSGSFQRNDPLRTASERGRSRPKTFTSLLEAHEVSSNNDN